MPKIDANKKTDLLMHNPLSVVGLWNKIYITVDKNPPNAM